MAEAVNEPAIDVVEGVNIKAVPCAEGVTQGGGGLKVNVCPLAGNTVADIVQLAALVAPAVVAAQLVVVVRLL